jgi:hypothetical protein
MSTARATLTTCGGAILGLAIFFGPVWSAVARETSRPPHLQVAMDLLSAVQPSDTNYQHKVSVVHFPGDPGSDHAECRTDCSGLLDAVLKRAYGLTPAQLSDWLKANRPLAKHYHEAIANERGFQKIATLPDVRPGDILAISYPAGAKENNTGHVMLVAGTPKQRTATAPIVEQTLQWEVPVIDESETGHGTTDTRHNDDHTSSNGLGHGVLRIYTERHGRVAGYAWSTQKVSKFVAQSSHNMVVGRVQLEYLHSLKSAAAQ